MNMLKIVLPLVLISFFISCGKDFGDLNIDPNNPRIVPPEVLLTGAEKEIATKVFVYEEFAFPEILSQSWAQNNYTAWSRYAFDGNIGNTLFQDFYSGILEDLTDIHQAVQRNPQLDSLVDKNRIAIANVLRVYVFQIITDIFGPVPYKEALAGAMIRTPKYDDQKTIYFGIIGELRDAIANMDESRESYGSADLIYGGDVSKWKGFANALMLRIAMRMSDAEPDRSKLEFESAYSNAISNNTGSAYFYYLTGTPNNNPLHQQRVERGDADYGLSSILIDNTLKPLNDPRLFVWAQERNKGGGYFGRPYGEEDYHAASEAPELYSQPSGSNQAKINASKFNPYDVLKPDAFSCLLGYSEVCFLMAEAKERNWNVPGTAREWYDKGIAASMQEWGVPQNDIDVYLQQAEVAYTTASGDWKQKIGVQKWLAFFMQGYQAWIEWRRLDFKKLELPVDGTLGDVGTNVAPIRLIYPTDEQSLNSINYHQALSLLGGPDKMYTRVWWDVR